MVTEFKMNDLLLDLGPGSKRPHVEPDVIDLLNLGHERSLRGFFAFSDTCGFGLTHIYIFFPSG